MVLNDSRERKRKEALEQMRAREETPVESPLHAPAVHPRYRAAYGSIYPEQETRQTGTLGVRIVISILLFAGFLSLDYEKLPSSVPQRTEILRQIQAPFSLPSVKQFDLTGIL